MAPLPAWANASRPPAQEPAMPSALTMRASSNPSRCPTVTAPPKGPVVPGGMEAALLIGVLGLSF